MNAPTGEGRKTSINLSIPPCPALLLEIMKAARQPDADTEKIAAAVKRDAAMTAALLQLANSPLSGIRHKITSVSQAISFLGMKATLNLLNNVALRQSMGGSSEKFAKFWERSSLCATVAARIARKVDHASPDDAYIAALFHDCGIPILIQHFPNYRETVMAESYMGQDIHEVENAHFSTTHAIVGNMLARTWHLPQHICQSILNHHDSTIFTSNSDRIDEGIRKLVGIICMADAIVDEHFLQKNQEWEKIEADALACLGLSGTEFREMKDDLLGFLNGE